MRNHFLRAGRVANLPSGGGSSIIDTDLYVHYDFSDTNCWNRQSGTNTNDYTIHNLANDYNDALIRSRTGTSDAFRNASDSPCIDFNSSDGGGCLETIPSNNSSDSDDCAIRIPGSYSQTTIPSSPSYNLTPVSATDTNNLMNGVGTGAYTFECWVKLYLDHSQDASASVFTCTSTPSSGYVNIINWILAYAPGYDFDTNRANKFRVYFGGFSTTEVVSISGAPSSGAAWSDWNHLVYSRNSTSTNDTKVYVNNSLVATNTDNNDVDSLSEFGLVYLTVANRVPERHGIFRFYRGKALTSSEVTTNWNAQKSRFGH
jgi:hypothetical protein